LTDELPPFARSALLLDADGTLLDIAPTPDAVVVAPGLTDSLHRLRGLLGDAVAVVTGRPVAQIDALFPGVFTAVSGEHGGALRPLPGVPLERADLPELPPGLRERAAALAAPHDGVILEHKARGFVLHYRLAPDAGLLLRDALGGLLAPYRSLQLIPAHMAWEIRPRGADKGSAVEALAAGAPFAGRLPVFIGDDVTDQDGMRAARTLGGAGLFVPDVFGDAAGVRDWLRRCAQEAGWAAFRA
jgi:trehalose 6-phosphate phosphatase